MNLNILFKDFPKICRCCLSYGHLQPILEFKDLEAFTAITNVKVKDEDKMPENVCLKCIKRIEDLSSFIEMCKANEKALKLIVIKELENADDYDNCNNDDVKSEDSVDKDFFLNNVKQEVIELEPDIVIQLNKEETITCENCSETFINVAQLGEHYKDFVKCRPKDSESKSGICNIVDYLKKPRGRKPKKKVKEESDEEVEFVKGKKLKGKRRFLCNYCGKNYTRKNGLERHMLSHTGIKPFECRECGKCYITKDTLKTHLLTHTGIKAHKCTICQKSFTQSSHLSYHMRRHAGEKPHTCTYCGKAFLSSYHLERHKLMHTGVKPYECKQCGKQFVRSTTLRDHMLIHTGEKPFQCQHCGKQFNRKQSLTNHVLVHTGEKYKNNSSSNAPLSTIPADSNLRLAEIGVNNLLTTDIPLFLSSTVGNKINDTGCEDVAPLLENSDGKIGNNLCESSS